MQTNGFYVNGACGSLFKKQIISSFISVILIKFRVCGCGGGDMGCIIYEGMMVKSNLTLPHTKQVILFAETLIHVLTFDDVKLDGVLK